MTEVESRNKVISTARSFLGCKEADGTHRKIIDIYNSIRPLPGGYRMTYSDPWCAAFVSAVGMASGVAAIIPGVNCQAMISEYQQHGQFVANRDYPAAPGDLIFYDWDSDGVSDHVGIIVEDTQYYYRTIEGNFSDMVKERTIAHGSQYIMGFAVPGYGATTAEQVVVTERPEISNSTPQSTTPTKACTVTLSVLHRGIGINNPNETVKAAQLLLIGKGCKCGPCGADGEFGDDTYAAVQRFQTQHKLAADGVIGPKTWAELLGGNV